jgi:anti-sigma-K factor RskA
VKTKEYIESGILEAYVLGALTPEEHDLVAANIAMYPDLQTELDVIETTMQQFATSLAMDPPAAVQEKIWNALQATSSNAGNIEEEKPRTSRTIPFEPERKKSLDWKYAAMLAILAGSVTVNFLMFNQSKQAQEDKVALNAKVQQLQAKENELAVVVNDYSKAKTMMADTGMQTIVMHTMVPGHAMAATLYWSKTKGEAYLAMNALPEPPKGMQYQMWVIQGGKPVSMGVLPSEMANTAAMQKLAMNVTSGDAFAISLEKEGGNPTPTAVYVLGKA